MTDLEPAAFACWERTRSAVVNVLIADGVAVAVTGLILRIANPVAPARRALAAGQVLLACLFALFIASHIARRIMASRAALSDPARRCERFLRAHVLSASIGSLAVLLGFLAGWLVRPRVDTVAPYWVAALALGVLSLPRKQELADFDQPMPPSTGPIS